MGEVRARQLSLGGGREKTGRKSQVFRWVSWKQCLTSGVLIGMAREQLMLLKLVLQGAAFPAAAEAIPDKTPELSVLGIRLPRDLCGLWDAL